MSETKQEQEARAVAWQPIETAPRDGTEVLAWCEESETMHVAYYCPTERLWFNTEGVNHFMSHWMPLPPVPGAAPQPAPVPASAEDARDAGVWRPHGADDTMRHPEASDLTGGETDHQEHRAHQLLRNLVSAAKAWGEARWLDDDDSMHDAGADMQNAIEAADRYLAALARQQEGR